jgi:hypothetical protein
VIVNGNQLQRGLTRSCGCLRKEVVAARMTVHGYCSRGGGEKRTRTYNSYQAAKGRKTLERIDNDGHYEPGNVRWATHQQQSNNKRNNRRVTAFGRTRTVAWWSRETRLRHSVIRERLDLGWSPEKALTHAPRVVRSKTSLRELRGRLLEAFGRKLTIAAWSRETGLSYHLIRSRLVCGWSAEEALSATRRWSRRGDGMPSTRSARSS